MMEERCPTPTTQALLRAHGRYFQVREEASPPVHLSLSRSRQRMKELQKRKSAECSFEEAKALLKAKFSGEKFYKVSRALRKFEEFSMLCNRFGIAMEEDKLRRLYGEISTRDFAPKQQTTLSSCDTVDIRQGQHTLALNKWKQRPPTAHRRPGTMGKRLAARLRRYNDTREGLSYDEFRRRVLVEGNVSDFEARELFRELDRDKTGFVTVGNLAPDAGPSISVGEWLELHGGKETREKMASAQRHSHELSRRRPQPSREEIKAKLERLFPSSTTDTFKRIGGTMNREQFSDACLRLNVTTERSVAYDLFDQISPHGDKISFAALSKYLSPTHSSHCHNNTDFARLERAVQSTDDRNKQIVRRGHDRGRRPLASLSPNEVCEWFAQHGLQAWGAALVSHKVTGRQLSRGIDDSELVNVGINLDIVRRRIQTLLASARVHGVQLMKFCGGENVFAQHDSPSPAATKSTQQKSLVDACRRLDVDNGGVVTLAEVMIAIVHLGICDDYAAVETFAKGLPVDGEGFFAYVQNANLLDRPPQAPAPAECANVVEQQQAQFVERKPQPPPPVSALAIKLRRRWNGLGRMLAKADKKKNKKGIVRWSTFKSCATSLGIALDLKDVEFISAHFCGTSSDGPVVYYRRLLRYVANATFLAEKTTTSEPLREEEEEEAATPIFIPRLLTPKAPPPKPPLSKKAVELKNALDQAAKSEKPALAVRTFRNILRFHGKLYDETSFFKIFLQICRSDSLSVDYDKYLRDIYREVEEERRPSTAPCYYQSSGRFSCLSR